MRRVRMGIRMPLDGAPLHRFPEKQETYLPDIHVDVSYIRYGVVDPAYSQAHKKYERFFPGRGLHYMHFCHRIWNGKISQKKTLLPLGLQ